MYRNRFNAVLFLLAFVAGVLAPSGQALAVLKGYTAPNPVDLSYSVTMPKAIHFATESGRDLTGDGLILETRANLFVDVTDTDRDGRIDAGDYSEITYKNQAMVTVSIDITPADLAAVSADFPGLTASSLDNFSDLQYYLPEKAKKVKEDWAKKAEELQLNYRRGVYVWTSTIGGANKDAITLSMPNGKLDLTAYPYRLTSSPITVTATQQGGDDNAKFPEQYATLTYEFSHERSGGVSVVSGDVVNKGILPQTPLLNFTVRPRDQGGAGGDNGGGSCDAIGLGTALLALPALGLVRRRKRR